MRGLARAALVVLPRPSGKRPLTLTLSPEYKGERIGRELLDKTYHSTRRNSRALFIVRRD